jgi:hypothetical protein
MGRKDHFRGILYVHRDHSFFFEHERAHIPGMYLIEAIRQMSTAVALELTRLRLRPTRCMGVCRRY